MFAFCAKNREKAKKILKTLSLQILASCAANCNFHHKSHFSSKTLILTNSFAYSELFRPVCLRFVPKIEKKQKKIVKTLSL